VLCLRGELPEAAELGVGESLSQWVAAEAFGSCQEDRANRLVSLFDEMNARWEAYAHGRH